MRRRPSLHAGAVSLALTVLAAVPAFATGCGGHDDSADEGSAESTDARRRDAGTKDAGKADAGKADAGKADAGHDGGDASSDAGVDSGAHAIKTVFLILMENHNWSSIKGSSSAPYINSLLTQGAHAEGYYDNPSAVHPSEPNYIWLESGDNLGITSDSDPAQNYQTTPLHLTTLLGDAGVSWRAYVENIDGASCPVTTDGLFAPKHTPMLFFSDVVGSPPSATSAPCIAHVRPYTELASDLEGGKTAQYNFITPNLCDDMHNGSGCSSSEVKDGDTWLSEQVPAILASKTYQDGGALFITWDESESGEHPIGMIVLSPFAKKGYSNTTQYYHSSMLRTVEEIFAVTPLLRDAANRPSLEDLFTTYP